MAAQAGRVIWQQAAVLKYQETLAADATTWTLSCINDSSVSFNVFSARRANGMVAFSGGIAIGGGNFPRTSAGAPIGIDLYKSGQAATYLQQNTDGTTLRISTTSLGSYIDSLLCGNTPTNADPAVGQRALNIRSQDASGAIQTRLTFDTGGGILAGAAAFAGTYAWMGGPSTMALDFRTMQTAGLQPGSVISGATMLTGQVARIMVNGGGAITLPASWHIVQGGAVWGTAYTIVSLVCIDGPSSFIFATFIPFQS